MQRVLITGADGRIGRFLLARMARADRVLRLLDVRFGEDLEAGPRTELVQGSAEDLDLVVSACAGVDAVVHLGGIPNEAPFDDVLRVNVRGTYCVLEAARRAGVPRVVLASSNHAAGMHGRHEAPPGGLSATVSPRPDTYYGWSKAALESLGRLYADRCGLDVVALRIGHCTEEPEGVRALSNWLSPDDAARLVEAAIATPAPGYRQVWGISRNTRRWLSLAEGEEIGFDPADDAERFAESILAGVGDLDCDAPEMELVGGDMHDTALGGED
ncbi:NAD-dependent epimerase/dehydratase family protein [Kineococcus xinjiangensis]|uniref:NAD-dependent epimerase/dehydratase family protein n=1 Tax=Kineococcus xinjiangensis TaxID=512762 RepID=A0A2S6IDY0_9ACTN|nr:NAD(P)-dependent oxidoreductase [Kineococcus xinjiangensis]PPK92424.1 NAD-dependent epimerase/dehydratase family protein [Kineococcus xinjiangensis]